MLDIFRHQKDDLGLEFDVPLRCSIEATRDAEEHDRAASKDT